MAFNLNFNQFTIDAQGRVSLILSVNSEMVKFGSGS